MDPKKAQAAQAKAQGALRKMFERRVTDHLKGVKAAEITPMEEKCAVACYTHDKRLG